MKKVITWVGLDVHSSSIAIAALPGDTDKPTVSEIPNEPKAIRRAFTRLKAGGGELRCCYEAGPCGYDLYRQLAALGLHCVVIAPALIPRRPGERIKTDRRDATKLARLYRAGELTAIRVPTPEEEATRDLIRAREDVRKDLIAARHRLSKFVLRHGHIYSEGKKWTERFWRWLRTLTFEHGSARATFEHYQIQVHHLLERKAALEKEIVTLAETEPYRVPVGRLTCLRGILTHSAMGLLAEVQDFRRFAKPRQLMSFVGLVPSEYSSGLKQQRGGITKTGNGHARRLLIEAAWAYRHPPALGPRTRRLLLGQPPEVVAQVKKAQHRLHKRYARLVGRGKKSQVAVTAVARELCGFIWALMREEAAA
jgi:transposase